MTKTKPTFQKFDDGLVRQFAYQQGLKATVSKSEKYCWIKTEQGILLGCKKKDGVRKLTSGGCEKLKNAFVDWMTFIPLLQKEDV